MRVILFNLFPYRLQRENRRKRRVLGELAAGAALGVLFCWGVTVEFTDRAEAKQAFLDRLGTLEADMAQQVRKVQDAKDRVEVLKRQVNALQAVEQESVLASQWVAYFDSTVPSNVSLTRLLVTDEMIMLNGFTPAVASLAQWVDEMESGNSLFESVDLVSVNEQDSKENGPAVSRHLFEIKAMLRGVSDAAQ